jgi:glutamate/tyrosine decarboxylase-like PLP-dependent enzyme
VASETDRFVAPAEERLDLASIFLGPKAENADIFERLLLEAFRDHVFWRRNVHPEDGFQITEQDKRTPAFERAIGVLSQELMGLLGELKAGVPFFSPRYIAHMSPDLTMASLIGYFATMLYNPNNVAAEASPVTTRLELEVAAQLAHMVGYDTTRHWGHLTGGGTTANFEAFWVAQTVKYLPVAVRGAADAANLGDLPVQLPDGSRADLRQLDLWQLLNIAPEAALDALESLVDRIGDPREAQRLVDQHSLSGLGMQAFGHRLAAHFGDALAPGVVLVPSTAHYSWEKICRALGIGAAQLIHVPVDGRFRMDPEALAKTLRVLAGRRQPVIACVAVVGSTEESAVDRIDLLAEVRREAGRELGLAFHLHADAAWGGYAVAITRGADGSHRSYQSALTDYAPEVWPEEGVYKALSAVGETDSVTIDPHKFGYVPYPAGAVLFRDRRVRELVAIDAPYVFHGHQHEANGHGDGRGKAHADEPTAIGRFIFEGSKPGAAAAGVWLSHKVLPLDATGYGHLIGAAARGALALQRRMVGGDWHPFRVIPFPNPDLNIVCFAIGHPRLDTLAAVNAFAERIYTRFSVFGGRPASQVEYFVTKTTLRASEYGRAALPIVLGLGFSTDDYLAEGGVSVMRCTVMDPFLASRRGKVDFVEGFAGALRRAMDEALAPD